MTTAQSKPKIVWIISRESREKIVEDIQPFKGAGWEVVHIPSFEVLLVKLGKYYHSGENGIIIKPDLVLLGGKINIQPDSFNIAPFYPVAEKEQPNLNDDILKMSQIALSICPNVRLIRVLGNYPRQAIHELNMERLEITSSLRLGMGMEGGARRVEAAMSI